MPLSNESFKRLLNNLPGMAYRCLNNRDWTMLFVSDGCHELTGYQPDEIVGDRQISYNKLIHKDYREIVFHQARKALNENRPFKYAYPIIPKSGKEKWVFEHGIGIYSEDDEATELEGFISDITQTVETEKNLEQANIFLKAAVRDSDDFCSMIGRSDGIRKVFNQILIAAESDANVIIYGESGTGKEMVAQAIHTMSHRKNERLVPVNCGAIPDNLIESEFFGYKRGAFSGAYTDKLGFLDQADGGTMLLDEVGEINPNMQIKLLRAIEDYGFTPIGGKQIHKPDIRIIASTNKDLQKQVELGKIREDFFFRIHVISIKLPPLRERKEDIPLLTSYFLKKFGGDKNIAAIPQELTRSMMAYNWPGNVRELQNFIYRYIASADTEFFKIKACAPPAMNGTVERYIDGANGEQSLQSWLTCFEKKIILKTLDEHNWNRGKTAHTLKIHYRSLLRKMKKYGIQQSQKMTDMS
jgi:PAS domain S-box-containing protein